MPHATTTAATATVAAAATAFARTPSALLWLLLLLAAATTATVAAAVEDHAAAEAEAAEVEAASDPPPAPVPPPLEGPNVCTRNETQLVRVTTVEMVPTTVLTYTWCLRVPPRCAKNRTEMRRKVVEHTVPRWRLVQYCCAGYRPAPDPAPGAGGRRCAPECPMGCAHGVCAEPHRCECSAGFSGLRCDTRFRGSSS